MEKSKSVIKITTHLSEVFETTENILNEWDGAGCLKFDTLFSLVATKLGWDHSQSDAHSEIIRFYIKNHGGYASRRGPGGGIMKSEDKAKLDAKKSEKLNARAEVEAMLKASLSKISKEDLGEE